ncbi:hypothetical protein BJ741DRAFT_662861 [Chytriomyces cf. hyalinus JEL632]|nr:hypothetical protein BJ741DRAFT_662861 [Chytriomyces cf. hyalinus JEL632]
MVLDIQVSHIAARVASNVPQEGDKSEDMQRRSRRESANDLDEVSAIEALLRIVEYVPVDSEPGVNERVGSFNVGAVQSLAAAAARDAGLSVYVLCMLLLISAHSGFHASLERAIAQCLRVESEMGQLMNEEARKTTSTTPSTKNAREMDTQNCLIVSLHSHARCLRLALTADIHINQFDFKDASLALFSARKSLSRWIASLNQFQQNLNLHLTELTPLPIERSVDAPPPASSTSTFHHTPVRAQSLLLSIAAIVSQAASADQHSDDVDPVPPIPMIHITTWISHRLDKLSSKFELVFSQIIASTPIACSAHTSPPIEHLPNIISLLHEQDEQLDTLPMGQVPASAILAGAKRLAQPKITVPTDLGSSEARSRSTSRNRPASADCNARGKSTSRPATNATVTGNAGGGGGLKSSQSASQTAQRKSVSSNTLLMDQLLAYSTSNEGTDIHELIDDAFRAEDTFDATSPSIRGRWHSRHSNNRTSMGESSAHFSSTNLDQSQPGNMFEMIASVLMQPWSKTTVQSQSPSSKTKSSKITRLSVPWVRKHGVLFWDRKLGCTYVVLRVSPHFVLSMVFGSGVGDGEEEGELWRLETWECLSALGRQLCVF